MGRAIVSSGLDRDEVFLTTKIWYEKAARADVIRSTERSLDRLGTDHVEHHPYLAIAAIREVAHGGGLAITACSPIARGAVLDDEVITQIAAAHDATPAQVTLAYLLAQRDTVVIPKSNTPARITENLAALDLDLHADEVDRIAALDRGMRQVDPPFAPAWDLPSGHPRSAPPRA